MTPDQLCRWEEMLFETQQKAANAISISVRQLRRYQNHVDPIPLKVELACAAILMGITSYDEAVKSLNKKGLTPKEL